MHHQRNIGVGADVDHRFRIGHRRRKGLLADAGHAGRGGHLDQCAVAGRSRGDVDEVKLFVREQLGRVAVGAHDPEVAGRGRQTLLIPVAQRDDLRTGQLPPGLQMVLREKAAADQGSAFHGRCLWRSADAQRGLRVEKVQPCQAAGDTNRLIDGQVHPLAQHERDVLAGEAGHHMRFGAGELGDDDRGYRR